MIGQQTCGRAGALLGRRGEESFVKSIRIQQILQIISGFDPAGVGEVLVINALGVGLRRAFAHGQPVVPVTDRPSILAAECDRLAAKLLHIGLQLAESGRHGIDASLLEQILGIPDATRLDSDRNAIDLAVIRHGFQ